MSGGVLIETAVSPSPQPVLPRSSPGRRRVPRPPRRLVVETLLVVLGAALLSLLMTWPEARPGIVDGAVPWDPTDARYFTWQVAWASHALVTDPLGLWTTNAFLRMPDNLAFTDAVLGYAPFGALVSALTGGGQAGALTQLNLDTIAADGLAFVGAWALARVLGSRLPGALLAGAAFGFAPWRLEQVTHLNVISTGAAALALAWLFRGHGWSLREGLRPERISPGFVLAGWLAAAWQVSFGFAVGVSFGYVFALVVAFLLLRVLFRFGRRIPWRLLVAHAAGAVIFLAVAGWMAAAFLRVVAAHPEARRDVGWLPYFSPPWLGWLTPPEASWIGVDHWKQQRTDLGWIGETLVSPGSVLILFALIGVLLSGWPLRRRLGVLGATAVAFVLAAGTVFPFGGELTFVLLWHHLPGWDSIRTPGRLTIWVTLGLCLLAAGALSRLTDLVWPPSGVPGARGPRPVGHRPSRPLRRRPRPHARSVLPRSRAALPRAAAGLVRPQPRPARWRLELTRRRRALQRRVGPPTVASGRARSTAWRPRRIAVLAAPLLVLPTAGVLVEGMRSETFPYSTVDPIGLDLKTLPQPLLILPTIGVWDYYTLVWSTDGFPTMVDGSSGFDPVEQIKMRKVISGFPDATSVAYLRGRHVQVVVMLRKLVDSSPWQGAAERGVQGLGISKVDKGAYLLYYLEAAPAAS